MQTELGHYYHCFNRGNNRQTLFYEKADYLYLIALLKRNSGRFNITVLAYCLMPNHYHLLLRQEGAVQVSRFIQSTFQSYSQTLNKKYNRTGRVYENPNPPKHVDDEAYLFQVIRYIHRNPLEAGLVNDLLSWSFSNYPEFTGHRKGNLYPAALIQEWFDTPEEYRRYVEEDFDNYDKIRYYLFE